MHNLIPHFIHEQYHNQAYHGELKAVTLFLDISGFTAMTQALMEHGKEGAEVMSDSINRVFEPLIHTVYAYGGFIVSFAGDAFTAVFPNYDAATAVAACQVTATVRRIFAERGKQQTPLGNFDLAVKQGLSAGLVEWGIIGPDGHKTYFFRGPAIDDCANSEHQAQPGEIILDEKVTALLPANTVQLEKINEQYAKLTALVHEPPLASTLESPLLPTQQTAVAQQFFSPQLLNLEHQGEFRDVISIFISYQNISDWQALNLFITQLIHAVDRYGGYFSQVDYGDKGGMALVFFGAPVAHENDIVRALDFVLTLQEELALIPGCQWRIGLTYGRGRAGFVGTAMRDAYTVLGSAVNLAARLMMQANWGDILVADSLAQHDAYQFNKLGDMPYKGFHEPVPTHQLIKKQSTQQRVFGEVMVGREAELSQLLTAVQPIFNGRFAGAAILYGEPGIGKSHLAFALRQALGETVSWFRGQADQVLQTPFGSFVYFLKHYFEQSPEATVAVNKTIFEQKLTQLISDLDQVPYTRHLTDELQRTKSFLGNLIGLHWPGALYETLDARGRYENSLFAVKTLLLAESQLHPTIFELEDGHRLDEASHELLTTLTRQIGNYPLFIIITSRYGDDGSRPPFHLDANVPTLTLDLNLLPANALQTLAESVLDGLVHEDIIALLQEKTQANPFFAQQILHYFRENDLLELDENGVWTLQADTFEMPTSISAVLLARIDRLTVTIKETVKVASVLGREFEVRLLSRMLQDDAVSLVQQVEEEQIWTPLRELRYIFKHSLLRDAAYEVQLRARLRELHYLAAQAYEALHRDDLSPYYAELAHHFGQAQAEEQEWHYARLAAEQAAAHYANDDALRYLARALALAPANDWAERYELLMMQEAVHNHIGDRADQSKDLNELSTIVGYLADPERETAVILRQANYGLVTSDYTTATTAAAEAIRLAQQASISQMQTEGHIIKGKSAWQQGNYEQAKVDLLLALDLAQGTGSQQDEAEALSNLGATYRHLGQAEAAQSYYQNALNIFQQTGDKQGEAGCLSTLGAIYGESGDYVRARHFAEQALTICHEIGFRRGETILNANLGGDYYDLGDYATAQSYLEQSLSLSRETGNRWLEALSLDTLGLVHRGLVLLSEANSYYESALTIQRDIGDRNSIAYTLTHLGYTLTDLGNYPAALTSFNEALQLRRELKQESLTMDVLAGLASLAWLQGEQAGARKQAQEVVAWLEVNDAEGVEYPVQVYLLCYRILQAAPNQAQTILQAGYTLLQKRAKRIKDDDLRQKFLENVSFHQELMVLWNENGI